MPKKSGRIGCRIPHELRERLDAIIRRHKTSDSIILEEVLPAFCEAVERADAIRFPIEIILSEQRELAVAEDRENLSTQSSGPKGGAPPGKASNKGQRTSGAGPTGRVPRTA